MPAGTDNVTDMFPVMSFSLTQRDDYCRRVWGYKPRANWTRLQLWGRGEYSMVISFQSYTLLKIHKTHIACSARSIVP